MSHTQFLRSAPLYALIRETREASYPVGTANVQDPTNRHPTIPEHYGPLSPPHTDQKAFNGLDTRGFSPLVPLLS